MIVSKGKNKSVVKALLFTVVAVSIVTLGTILAVNRNDVHAAGGMTFSLLATHPEANVQSTTRGKTITDLSVDGTTLYTGYGDYGVNTGPVHINPFNLTTGSFTGSVLLVPTEETSVIRKINGSLYLPMTDPQLPSNQDVGFATNEGGTWVNRMEAPAIHFFDMATLDGSDLWMVGSADEADGTTRKGATAYRSTDGGATWNIVANDATTPYTPPSTVRDFDRYYWIASLGGKMYMQAEGVTPAPPVRIFDGTTWTTGTTTKVCGVSDPALVEVFAGNIVCAPSSTIRLFNGTTVETVSVLAVVGTTVHDLYVDNGYIYAVGNTGIARSSDGRTWQKLATPPTTARSIAVYNDRLYLGTSTAQILVSDTTITDRPLVTPGVTSVSPNNLHNKVTTQIIIQGNDISNPTVTIGGVPVSVVSSTATSVTVSVPPRDYVGPADVTVTNGDGATGTLQNGVTFFEYPEPVVASTSFQEVDGVKQLVIGGDHFIVDEQFGWIDGLESSLVSLNGTPLPFCTAGTTYTAEMLAGFGYNPQYFSDSAPCYRLFRVDGGTVQEMTAKQAIIILPDDFDTSAPGFVSINSYSARKQSESYYFNTPQVEENVPGAPSTGRITQVGGVNLLLLVGLGVSIAAIATYVLIKVRKRYN